MLHMFTPKISPLSKHYILYPVLFFIQGGNALVTILMLAVLKTLKYTRFIYIYTYTTKQAHGPAAVSRYSTELRNRTIVPESLSDCTTKALMQWRTISLLGTDSVRLFLELIVDRSHCASAS